MAKEIDDKQIAAIFKIRNDAEEKIKKKGPSETYVACHRGIKKAASEILYILDLSM